MLKPQPSFAEMGTSKILSWDKQPTVQGTLYPVSREGHSVTYVPSKGILMFGGLGSSLFSELFFYDPKEHCWSLLNVMGRYPTPRCYHQAFDIGTNPANLDPYFVIHAGQGEAGRSLGDMYILNLKAKTPEWKRIVITKPPQSRH